MKYPKFQTSPFSSIWLEISINWHTNSQGPKKNCVRFSRGRIYLIPHTPPVIKAVLLHRWCVIHKKINWNIWVSTISGQLNLIHFPGVFVVNLAMAVLIINSSSSRLVGELFFSFSFAWDFAITQVFGHPSSSRMDVACEAQIFFYLPPQTLCMSYTIGPCHLLLNCALCGCFN